MYLEKSFKNRSGQEASYMIKKGVTPVLLIPGFGCNHTSFLPICEFFSSEYELIIPDNRGMGKLQNIDSSYSLNDLAKDCEDLMKELGHNQFHIVGTSMGGFVAQIIATTCASSVLSLSLLCTTSNHEDFVEVKIYTEEELTSFYAVPVELGTTLSTDTVVNPKLKENNPNIYKNIIKIRLENRVELSQLLWQRSAVEDFFLNDKKIDLTKLELPTLIMTGSGDRFVNSSNAQIFKSKIKHAKLIEIDDTDHLFFMEKPSETVFGLNSFWENL
jgi:pimeloyl-ACP methyl ester carboxylesterase